MFFGFLFWIVVLSIIRFDVFVSVGLRLLWYFGIMYWIVKSMRVFFLSNGFGDFVFYFSVVFILSCVLFEFNF